MATEKDIQIPDQVVITMRATSHAAWEQYLTISCADFTVQFSGTGENVPMKTSDGETQVTQHARRTGGILRLSFSSSGNPNPRVQDPVETKNGTLTVYSITSEDDTDNDNNDTYAVIILEG